MITRALPSWSESSPCTDPRPVTDERQSAFPWSVLPVLPESCIALMNISPITPTPSNAEATSAPATTRRAVRPTVPHPGADADATDDPTDPADPSDPAGEPG